MPHERCKLSGRITHVFSHRFVVQTPNGAFLADVTPHGADMAELRVGASVVLEGEQKPSEFKVTQFTCGGKTVAIAHKRKHHHDHHGPGDPTIALQSARSAGFEPIGEPRRKPKHFEVLGLRDGRHCELHIELDGRIRKTRTVDDQHKWSEAMRPE